MKYATPYDEKKMARALGVALPISTKKAVELCSFVKGRELSTAVRLLEAVMEEKVAIPFRRYARGGTGHRPGGIGPGRYPKKACAEVVKLLKQAEANAKVKGLDTAKLIVSSILANKGALSWHFGRQRRRRMKRTHVEIVVSESEAAAAGKEESRKTEAKAAVKEAKAKSPQPAAAAVAKNAEPKHAEVKK
ncbi:50S ribosomal protein L22 [Candidatus Woesearchaeota archaeon]|nr:50S ribosomal protein L22 [Candidatus Woesearchaeota archaeon]